MQEVQLTEGPPVAAARLSVTHNMIALQRSANQLQFMDIVSSKTFVQVWCWTIATSSLTASHTHESLHAWYWSSANSRSKMHVVEMLLESVIWTPSLSLHKHGQGPSSVALAGCTKRQDSHPRVLLDRDKGLWLCHRHWTWWALFCPLIQQHAETQATRHDAGSQAEQVARCNLLHQSLDLQQMVCSPSIKVWSAVLALLVDRSPHDEETCVASKQRKRPAAWPPIPTRIFFRTGMETYSLQNNKQSLEMRQHFSHTVTWWKYSHEVRLLLLGTLDKSMWIQVSLTSCPLLLPA